MLERCPSNQGRVTHYKELFADNYKPKLYANTALLMKRIETFLGSQSQIERRDRNNLKFYLAMYVACVLCESAKLTRAQIRNLDLEKLTSSMLTECTAIVSKEYQRLIAAGGQTNDPDQVAKGTTFITRLQDRLAQKYPLRRQNIRPTSTVRKRLRTQP